VQAFDASPIPEHLIWLYGAADEENRTVKNKEFARAIYNKIIAYRTGEADAIAGVAWLDEERGDLKSYINGMAAAANLGMLEAQNNIGYYYMVGQRGLPRDLQQAKAWLTLSANQGYEHARQKLAVVDSMIAADAKK
jgi:TPR repeat protein